MQVENFMISKLDLTDKEAKKLTDNSIERVVNLAIQELGNLEGLETVAESDLIELKPLICKIWYAAQQAVIAKTHNVL